MAEITKITSPMVPKENLGNKYKPVSDQAFDLNSPNKVSKSVQDQKIGDREGGSPLKDNLGRSMIQPLLREPLQFMHALQKMVAMIQMGISTSDIVSNPHVRELLDSLFVSPEQLLQLLKEQSDSAVLFKGPSFDLLRDLAIKYPDNPQIREAVTALLDSFEQNLNVRYSMKSVLYYAGSLLDYLFTADRSQFSGYLQGLTDLLFPPPGELPQGGQAPAGGELENAAQAPGKELPQSSEQMSGKAPPQSGEQAPAKTHMDPKEAAQLMKNNLLPLLGEVVNKYHQNPKIRDIVMTIIHSVVRVDKGAPESLRQAVTELASELRQLLSLPENFERGLFEALLREGNRIRLAQDQVMEKLSAVISQSLRSPGENPAVARQAEALLQSLLQNQSSLMDVLHFVLPLETDQGRVFGELYVDPDNDERPNKNGEQTRKMFLSVESEKHGTFELCFWQTAERVDFMMWCPEALVVGLSGIRRQVGEIMALHGYTLGAYRVEELTAPQSIAQVFPSLLTRKVGIDVRI